MYYCYKCEGENLQNLEERWRTLFYSLPVFLKWPVSQNTYLKDIRNIILIRCLTNDRKFLENTATTGGKKKKSSQLFETAETFSHVT